MPNRLRDIIVVVVTSVWGANFVAPVFVSTYKPIPELNIAFMAILGVLLATKNGEPPADDDPRN